MGFEGDCLTRHSVRLTWGTDARIVSANGACDAVLRRPQASLVGARLAEALRISEGAARALDARARSGAGVEFVQLPGDRVLPKSPGAGEPPPVYLRLDLGEQAGEAVALVHDLTALLKGAPPLQISKLSSSLSHEIRNPLSSVKMAVQTLARNPGLSERDQRRLTIAQREIRTMERMLWLLSEYGRDTPPHLETVTIHALVQQSLEMIEAELAERQSKVELHAPKESSGDELKVHADTGRLRPVLAQVILNAAVGLEPGGVVSVEARRSSGAGGATVELSVDDLASSLVESERPTLFVPFGSRLARGAGLSLAALKQVMVRQGGDVTAEPREKGTVFTLTFPSAEVK